MNNPYRIHGIIFDLGFLFGNFVIIGPLLDRNDPISDQTLGYLLLAAVAAQFIGALIKKRPLGARLTDASEGDEDDVPRKFMNALLFFHFIIFTVFTLMGLSLIGAIDPSQEGTFWGDDIWIILSLLVGVSTTFVVLRAGQPAEKIEGGNPFSWLVEYGADLLLSISVIIITRFMWEELFTDLTNVTGIGLNGRSVVFLGALSILFVVFYLPGRYLFFIEDYRHPGTWLRLWLPMLPIAWTVLIG